MRASAVSTAVVEVIAHRVPDRPGEVAVPCALHGKWETRRVGNVPARSPHFDRCHDAEVALVIDPAPFNPAWRLRIYGGDRLAPEYALWSTTRRGGR